MAELRTPGLADRSVVAGVDQEDLRQRARAELTQNILPFWSTVAVDHERGGFHGRVSNDLQIDDSVERTAVICARVLWAFSAAARVLDDPDHLRTADHAYAYLVDHFVDPVHGGVFWSVDAEGVVVDDRKQTYAQAFAVYGLAEYARARNVLAPLELAVGLVELIEEHGADRENGGYFEARSRTWHPIPDVRLSPRDLNAPKSMNTLLHVMEAYTTFAEVTQSGDARRRLAALVTTILDEVVDHETGHFRLFFDSGWNPLSAAVSYGHDIEGAWLLTAAARTAGKPLLVARAERAAVMLADAVYREGRDQFGAVLYEFRPASDGVPAQTNRDSHWWAQAEGAVGFLDACRITGERRFLDATAECWDVIASHHVDSVHGDWFKVLDPQRRPQPISPKVGPWECPYHHVRACLELIGRLPVTTSREEGPES